MTDRFHVRTAARGMAIVIVTALLGSAADWPPIATAAAAAALVALDVADRHLAARSCLPTEDLVVDGEGIG